MALAARCLPPSPDFGTIPAGTWIYLPASLAIPSLLNRIAPSSHANSAIDSWFASSAISRFSIGWPLNGFRTKAVEYFLSAGKGPIANSAPIKCPSLPRVPICLANSIILVNISSSILNSCEIVANLLALSIVVSITITPSTGSANTTNILSPLEIRPSPIACKIKS